MMYNNNFYDAAIWNHLYSGSTDPMIILKEKRAMPVFVVVVFAYIRFTDTLLLLGSVI